MARPNPTAAAVFPVVVGMSSEHLHVLTIELVCYLHLLQLGS